jgi:AraC-like DNA-binding protein
MKSGMIFSLCRDGCSVKLILVSGPAVDHDQTPAAPDPDPAAVLSDAFGQLHLNGAIFLAGFYSESWAYESAPVEDLAKFLIPDVDQVILFHVIAEGRCWVEVEGGERHWADAGDVVVLPYGDLHRMGGTSDAAVVASASSLVATPPWDRMPVIQYGEGGDQTQVLCGYLTSDDALFDPQMRALPPAFVVSPTGAAREWVRASIDYAMHQTTLVGDDRFEVPPHIPQLLLIEVLKLHLASAPATEAGFVTALRDPVVGPAMALIHENPDRKWTVAGLAAAGNVSVSLLDERFREVLGRPPIRYLTGWRMHVAQDLLTSTDLGVGSIARRVGYESEEAFSRAFKRAHGESPSIWRRGQAGDGLARAHP